MVISEFSCSAVTFMKVGLVFDTALVLYINNYSSSN